MADDATRKPEPEIHEPPSVAPPRPTRPDPGVIEGEATEIHEDSPPPEAAPLSASATAAEAADQTNGAPPRMGGFDFSALPLPAIAGGLGALIGAALALVAAWLIDPRAAALDSARGRLALLEHNAETQSAVEMTFDQRLAALEKGAGGFAKTGALDALGRRVGALETANAGDAAKTALDEARAARADAAKALDLAQRPASPSSAGAAPEAVALAPRLDRLENDVAAAKTSLGALDQRLAKLEGASSAPKTEARLAPGADGAADDAPAAAVLALSLDERFAAGAPFAAELAALAKRGVGAAALAALKPFADSGAPTSAAIAAGWAAVEPRVAAADASPAASGWDRLLDHMRALVRIRRVGGAAGSDDPDARLRTIGAALARGDVPGALAAFSSLPDVARAAGADWAKTAAARQAAAAAAAALRADALAHLAAAKD